ncbi:MAG: hypothetical protein IPK10_05485 [Bacteroidetes bacterium]|nr:hypothetical protein [Bacteroidota bacterium]
MASIFDEICGGLDIGLDLIFEPNMNSLTCDMLEEAIINCFTYKDIPNVTDFYPDLLGYLYTEFWSFADEQTFVAFFSNCSFQSKLEFHNPNLCSSLQSMADLINSAQPPVINASDVLAQDVFINVFPDKSLIYARNVLRFCGLYDPQVTCSDINTLYNNWLVADLDEPIPFHEYANESNEWNYPSES